MMALIYKINIFPLVIILLAAHKSTFSFMASSSNLRIIILALWIDLLAGVRHLIGFLI